MSHSDDIDQVPDLYRLAFIPGCFRCPKCQFQLSKTCINPNLEIIGTRAEDRQSEPCPNDGTMMVHVTYREQLEMCSDRLVQEFMRYELLQTALTESLKLQSHYALLLNMYDGGTRLTFPSIEEWVERLK